ncbi:MAG: glycosyltransferase family 4 protein [Candidatus Omnitrophica bacterium]|nr:glycosyltransferase family 4 protein [Candidatus Omnitrophota bacterium]
MKVIYYIAWNEIGGGTRHLASLMTNLKPEFDSVVVCCSAVADEYKEFFLKAGFLPEQMVFIPRWQKWLIVPLAWTLAGLFRRIDPNIVHSFGIQADMFCGLAGLFRNRQVFMSYFESQPLTPNTGWIKNNFYSLMNKMIGHRFTRSIAVSEGIKREIIDCGLRRMNEIEVVHLGLEEKKYVPADQDFKGLKQRAPVIGTVTRFSHEKRLERLLYAIPYVLRQCPCAQFVLVGQGVEEIALKQLAKRLDIEQSVEFKSWVKDPYESIRAFDIYVMPSEREGCPNALLEAMMMARPVVASNIPGIDEIVRNGQDGILVNTADPQMFAEALIKLCQDPQKSIKMGQQGRQRVLENFLIGKEIKKLKEIYTASVGQQTSGAVFQGLL